MPLDDPAEQPQLQRQALDLAGVILLVLDANGRTRMINEAGCRMLGYESADLIGKDWFESCIPEEDRDRVRGVFQRLIDGERDAVTYYENSVLNSDGERRTIRWHNRVLTDAEDTVIGTLSSGQDLTERREAEAALRDSEARMRAVVNTAVDGIVTIDRRGVIRSFNPAAERMFGYVEAETVGQNVSMLMPKPYAGSHNRYIDRYLQTGERRIIGIGREVIGLRKDGSTFPLDLAVSETRIGERIIFTGILRDITERKRLEREVLETSTREQQRIGRDLHDGLGQELTGIALLGGVLQRKLAGRGLAEAAEVAELVTLVNEAIEHTRALVRGLCPVRLESDGLMVALADMAESVHSLHQIECVFDCPTPLLIDDYQTATHLYYIANEATHNAVKHGEASLITVRLIANDDGAVTLAVEDDGVGVDPAALAGDGRGMHIMKYRAHMIDATLDVAPRDGGGTRVACSLKRGSAIANDDDGDHPHG